jgi:hypothetical protein
MKGGKWSFLFITTSIGRKKFQMKSSENAVSAVWQNILVGSK